MGLTLGISLTQQKEKAKKEKEKKNCDEKTFVEACQNITKKS